MLVFFKGEASGGLGRRGTYREVKCEGSGSKKLLYTVFMLIALVSTYFILENYDIIQANDVYQGTAAEDDLPDDVGEVEASEQPQDKDLVEVYSSLALYNFLVDKDLHLGRGRVSDGVALDCEMDSLLELAAKSSIILVEQELECEKAYNVTSELIKYRLHDFVSISLIADSGTYLWSTEYVHVLDEWNEVVFLLYKIPITETEFSEAEWSGYERLEILSGLSEKLDDPAFGPYWVVTLRVRNVGGVPAIINYIYVNDVPVAAYGASKPVDKKIVSETAQGLVIIGETKNIRVFIDGDYGNLSTGTTINLKLHSDGGMDYIKLIRLT